MSPITTFAPSAIIARRARPAQAAGSTADQCDLPVQAGHVLISVSGSAAEQLKPDLRSHLQPVSELDVQVRQRFERADVPEGPPSRRAATRATGDVFTPDRGRDPSLDALDLGLRAGRRGVARRAGNPPAPLDEAKTGHGAMEGQVRHRQPKGTVTDWPSCTSPRQLSTLLDVSRSPARAGAYRA
jgi:hypothetical protein